MATVSAAGDVLPPLVIFRGKYLTAGWKTTGGYPGIKIAITENGWMNSKTFYDWMVRFCVNVTQRPILLVYDGHSTHLTLIVITLARERNISLLKLLPRSEPKRPIYAMSEHDHFDNR